MNSSKVTPKCTFKQIVDVASGKNARAGRGGGDMAEGPTDHTRLPQSATADQGHVLGRRLGQDW